MAKHPGSLRRRGETYQLRLCVGGQRHTFTVHTEDKEEAKQFARTKQAELERQVQRRDHGLPGPIHMSALLERFEADELPTKTPGTQRSYRDSLTPIETYFVTERGAPMIVYNETDLAAVCGPTAACSPNGLGANLVTGRATSDTQTLDIIGTSEVAVTMAASEVAKIYAYLEISPTTGGTATRNWFKTFLTFGFNVSSKNNLIDWVRTDVCHVSAACTSLETLGSDTTAVNIGADDPAFRQKVLTLSAAAVPVATGDKLLILLSFTNNSASPQTFGWTPSLPVTLTDWGGDRSVELTLGRKRRKQRHADDEAVLLLDDEPYE